MAIVPRIAASLVSSGVMMHRLTGLPRWLLGVPAVGAGLTLIGVLGFVPLGLTLAWVLMSMLDPLGKGVLILMIWLGMESIWLLIRGPRIAKSPGPRGEA